MAVLEAVDRLEVTILVDNVTDNLSSVPELRRDRDGRGSGAGACASGRAIACAARPMASPA